jgi:hypothetical protein
MMKEKRHATAGVALFVSSRRLATNEARNGVTDILGSEVKRPSCCHGSWLLDRRDENFVDVRSWKDFW